MMMGIMFGNGMNSIIIGTMMDCRIFHTVGEMEFARLGRKVSADFCSVHEMKKEPVRVPVHRKNCHIFHTV